MNKCNVLIPSAKIVPESLHNIGKLPAVIYPVNSRIVFDYLYEQYAKISGHIKIICYENSGDVVKKLSRYGKNVVIQILDELYDLGYTIYNGLEGENDSVIINFADTIITENINDFNGDCFFYGEDYFSEEWTFFEMEHENHGAFTKIIDKKNFSGFKSEQKGKIFAGVFKIMQPQKFRLYLERALNNPSSEISSFYQAISDYNKICPMTAIKTLNWFDIGHADKYFISRLEVSAREFNHVSIDRTKGILYKSSKDTEKFIKEIKWYLKLPSKLEYTHPRIFNYSLNYNKPYIAMEYYAYHTIHELFLYGDINFHKWADIFSSIRSVCKDFMRYTASGDDIKPALENMYLVKTLERLDVMRSDKNFSRLFDYSITINGKKYISLNEICGVLKKYIPEILYDCDKFSIIHGDLCLTNIMIDSNLQFIKLIDPRGSFGSYDIYGDPRYDLAKLLHSIEGRYDFIIKDLFGLDFDVDNMLINYEFYGKVSEIDFYNLFTEVFKEEINENIQSIKLIEALLFLSMIPLHNENTKHQVLMLSRGIEILNEVIPITKE